MVVDDEQDIHYILKTALEREGYDVVEMLSGIECLQNIDKIKPDLVLMDIMMPDMDGWEVCKQIKEDKETRKIPVIMFTVRTSDDSKKKSFEYSKADAQIDKPFTRKELLETIEKIVINKKT